jgi:hypothetical protein
MANFLWKISQNFSFKKIAVGCYFKGFSRLERIGARILLYQGGGEWKPKIRRQNSVVL